jgi:hypothetical protein
VVGATDREEFLDWIWNSNPGPVDPGRDYAPLQNPGDDLPAVHQGLDRGQAFVSLEDLELVDVPPHYLDALSPTDTCVALRNSDSASNSEYATNLRL